jgi:hypothetical protein
MYIYKIINKINGRWYIGKTNGKDPNYMGSGKILKQAYEKYGKDNFEKIILENCSSEKELNEKEIYWIERSAAITDPMSYNLVEGGTGGDRSKFIDYSKMDFSKNNTQGMQNWFNSLTEEDRKVWHAKQAEKRTKGWYVSRIDNPVEIYVQNISKWCEEHGVDKSMPTGLNDPKCRLFQKQTKGWRIRRADMPILEPYVNKRKIGRPNTACSGKGWKLIDGKRVWYDK